tara:strand:- start:98 stop:1117 length:1020 start_codon:yes stop_codon:yes gene_type:complete
MSVIVTPEIARRAARIIEKYHGAVAASLYGQESVEPEAWRAAIDLGFVDPDSGQPAITQQLHTYGAFIAHHEQAADATSRYGLTADDFIAEIERNPIPQTAVEHQAAVYSRRKAAQRIVGLGNREGATLGSKLIEADHKLDKELRSTIRDVISARFGDDDAAKRMKQRGVERGLGEDFFDHRFRSTVKEMVSDMGHATGDWTRDFTRIVQTESHTAVQEGLAESWKDREQETAQDEKRPVDRIIAYKIPRADACDDCIRLYLQAGVPRLFYLDDLEANGTNVGLRRADWKAVVGTMHPYCACALARLPKYVSIPKGWRSGQSAPSVVGADGTLVIPGVP